VGEKVCIHWKKIIEMKGFKRALRLYFRRFSDKEDDKEKVFLKNKKKTCKSGENIV
jgi:hypothetical protein